MLNQKAYKRALELIRSGKVDHASGWSFGAADGDKILGPEKDWGEFSNWFLMVVPGANPETKEAFKYPFGKDGKVYRSGLVAIRQRAAQQNETEIFEAAGRLLEEVDKGIDLAAREAMATGTGRVSNETDSVFRADIEIKETGQAEGTGMVWEAVLIAPGLSRSTPPFYWTEEVLQQAAPVFHGVDINAYEVSPGYYGHMREPGAGKIEDLKRYLTSKKAGWAENPEYRAGMGIVARVHFLPNHAWIPESLQAGQSSGADVHGLSIDVRYRGFPVLAGESTIIVPTEILSASSVDVVTRPAAGGRFLRSVAAEANEETQMDRAKLMAIIRQNRPELLTGKDDAAIAAMTEEDILALVQQSVQKPEEGDPGKGAGKQEKKPDTSNGAGDSSGQRAAQSEGLTPEQVQEQIKKALEDERVAMASERLLEDALDKSGLPAGAVKRVKRLFESKRATQAEIDAAIKEERDYLAAMAQASGIPAPWGDQSRTSVGLGPVDKIQFAIDRAFGLTKQDMTDFARMERLDGRPIFNDYRAAQAADFDDVPRLTGLREFYILVSGDNEISGQFNRRNLPADLRAAQEVTSSTFSYILGNTLNRRLVKDYNELNGHEELLISERKAVKDFRLQEAIALGYPDDLPLIDPETDDYVEGAEVTDEEATYSVKTRGRLLTITRKVIINDDMGLVRRRVSREGRAARGTHARYVWAFAISNKTCTDGTAWFTSGHGNLGAVALSHVTALVGYKALANMTEKDSGNPLGLLDGGAKPALVYPVALMETGEKIANEDFYYTTNDLTTKVPNPLKGKVTPIMLSLLADAGDWYMILPPALVDIVEMGYLNGRQEPEMFVADAPDAEHVLRRDRIIYKVRHEYDGTVVDWRSGYKGAVT
jgi:hypothetical protein